MNCEMYSFIVYTDFTTLLGICMFIVWCVPVRDLYIKCVLELFYFYDLKSLISVIEDLLNLLTICDSFPILQ